MDNLAQLEKNLNGNEEFTFKQLFALIKKSFLRIVIFCAAALLVMGIVLVSVYFSPAAQNETASVVINYNFKGITEGLDPLGRIMNPNLIKSPAIVQTAMKEQKIPIEKQNEILTNLTVSAVLPKGVTAEQIAEEHPSSYILTIRNFKECGLNKNNATAFLNAMVSNYRKMFQDFYPATTLVPIIRINNEDYDYIDLYDIYLLEINTIISYLNAKASEAPTFRNSQTGVRFIDLSKAAQILRDNDLTSFESYVLDGGITKDPLTLRASLSNKEFLLQQEATRLNMDTQALKTILEEVYQNGDIILYGIVDPNPNAGGYARAIGGPTEQYDKMFDSYVSKIQQSNNVAKELSILAERIKAFDGVLKNEGSAETQLDSILQRINKILEETNDAITEYYEDVYFANAVSSAVGAQYSTNRGNIMMILLIVTAFVVILAAVTAMIVTNAALKKKGIPLQP